MTCGRVSLVATGVRKTMHRYWPARRHLTLPHPVTPRLLPSTSLPDTLVVALVRPGRLSRRVLGACRRRRRVVRCFGSSRPKTRYRRRVARCFVSSRPKTRSPWQTRHASPRPKCPLEVPRPTDVGDDADDGDGVVYSEADRALLQQSLVPQTRVYLYNARRCDCDECGRCAQHRLLCGRYIIR